MIKLIILISVWAVLAMLASALFSFKYMDELLILAIICLLLIGLTIYCFQSSLGKLFKFTLLKNTKFNKAEDKHLISPYLKTTNAKYISSLTKKKSKNANQERIKELNSAAGELQTAIENYAIITTHLIKYSENIEDLDEIQKAFRNITESKDLLNFHLVIDKINKSGKKKDVVVALKNLNNIRGLIEKADKPIKKMFDNIQLKKKDALLSDKFDDTKNSYHLKQKGLDKYSQPKFTLH